MAKLSFYSLLGFVNNCVESRGWVIIIWTGLNIKIGIAQKVYELCNCSFAKMIVPPEKNFGKRTVQIIMRHPILSSKTLILVKRILIDFSFFGQALLMNFKAKNQTLPEMKKIFRHGWGCPKIFSHHQCVWKHQGCLHLSWSCSSFGCWLEKNRQRTARYHGYWIECCQTPRCKQRSVCQLRNYYS